MIGNDSNIAVFDFSDQSLQAPRPQIMDTGLQTLIASAVHHSIQKRGLAAVNSELCTGDRLACLCKRIHREIQPVSFNQGSVIHDHEALGWSAVWGRAQSRR